jgi:hypothetical protein
MVFNIAGLGCGFNSSIVDSGRTCPAIVICPASERPLASFGSDDNAKRFRLTAALPRVL